MTQLGQLYEKEKVDYANQKVRESDIKYDVADERPGESKDW